MVFRSMPLKNLDLVRPANLPHNFSQPQGDLTAQNRFPVFCRPPAMKLYVKPRVGRCTVLLHASKCT